jgi:hypothetical protein
MLHRRRVRLLGELGLSFDVCLRPGERCDAVARATACPVRPTL